MARDRFDLVVSDLVIDEASDGDPQAALRRLAFASQLRRVAIPPSAAHIASLWARQRIHDCLASLGARSPAIATPEEIIESL